MYCSIGGVANRDRVAAVRNYMDAIGGRTIIAFDNDEAGRKWLQAYPDFWTAASGNVKRMPDRIFKKNNHIAIDGGCAFGGRLSAICLDTGEEFYV